MPTTNKDKRDDRANSYNGENLKVYNLVRSLKGASYDANGLFDSASSDDFIAGELNQTGSQMPEKLHALFDQIDESKRSVVTKALLDGIANYETEHGCECPADIVNQAIHNAFGASPEGRKLDTQYDAVSASNSHADNFSLQPNRAVIAILTTFTESIPWAMYLPADIRSNEARLGILGHRAATPSGLYAKGDSLDGVNSGKPFIGTSRIHTATATMTTDDSPTSTGKISGKISYKQTARGVCDQTVTATKILRGRTLVYVAGRVVAHESEANKNGSGNSPISGSFSIEGTEYTISGNINSDTGAFDLQTTPNLPGTVPVMVEGFLDYEADPSITPQLESDVEVFRLFANPWRVLTRLSPDARTQISNEFGLDAYSESILAVQAQFANERHKDALFKGLQLAQNNKLTFDYAAASAHQDAALQEVWRDFAAPLNEISQIMAERTIDHGVTHLYVTKKVASHLAGLPTTFFEPSGITARPSIYRLGRLFGRYEVYYTPDILSETTNSGGKTSAQILCVGRASDVARNPIVMGDAVAPTVIPLLAGDDLRSGAGFYARNFTCVNPHEPSSNGFGLIEVTNL